MAKKFVKHPASLSVIDDYMPSTTEFGQYPFQRNVRNPTARDQLYQWYYSMPEMRGIVNTVVYDVFGEGYEVDATSQAKVKKVTKLLRDSKFNVGAKAFTRDALISGDSYMGKASITREQAEDVISSSYAGFYGKSAESNHIEAILAKAAIDSPDTFKPRRLFPLSSRAMKISFSPHGVIQSYVQQVKMGTITRFDPAEIIHYAYEPVGDNIYGSSPFESGMDDLEALYMAKKYGRLYFENDATPSYLYKFPDESPDSQNVKAFLEKLRQHKQNPHRSMIVTGAVEAERMNALNKDMEFSGFINSCIQRILFACCSTQRYSHAFTGKPDTSANLEGYFKFISNIQDDISELFNSEFFEDWGVDFSFKRVYKRDETREADIVLKLRQGGFISINEGREYVGYKRAEGAEYDKLMPPEPIAIAPSKKTDVESGDARSEQSATNPSGPSQPKEGSKVDTEGGSDE